MVIVVLKGALQPLTALERNKGLDWLLESARYEWRVISNDGRYVVMEMKEKSLSLWHHVDTLC